jgi:hypothetical protein
MIIRCCARPAVTAAPPQSPGEASESYVRLGATWDADRARGKVRDLGVRRRDWCGGEPHRGKDLSWASL